MPVNIESYKNMLQQPWGKIQYEITFAQLRHIEGLKVLDFGSGFGLVSAILAQKNEVLSIEPNQEMLYANQDKTYKKILGSIEEVEQMASESFDLVVCHNVLEYVVPEERERYLSAFKRVLKPNGRLSIVKHNQVGKVLQSVVFSNDVDGALGLLKGEEFKSVSFSQGSSYTLEELLNLSSMQLENYLAIRTFYSLQPNDFKMKEDWLEKMTEIELAVADLKPYKDISFLQHVWLKK